MDKNVADILKVDITKLSTLGDNLLASDFNFDFDQLNQKMSEITNSWLDLEGEHFQTVFESFVTDAKTIHECVENLGTFAKERAAGYMDTLDQYTAEMNKVSNG